MRLSLLIIFLSACFFQGFAQQPVITPVPEKKGVIYNKEFTFGAKLTSNGWGVSSSVGKILNIHRTRLWYFEFADIRHPKEKKQSAELSIYSPGFDSPRDFYYGKQNDFFVMRVGFGYKQNLAEKARRNGVNLSMVYMGGLSLGFLKPYYLKLAYFVQSPGDTIVTLESRTEKYNDDPVNGNAEQFLNWRNILGAAPYGKGFKEIEPVPGAFGKFALNFEWGARDNFITALEAGVIIDVYYKKIPIMILENNKPFFCSVYLGFQIGKRH